MKRTKGIGIDFLLSWIHTFPHSSLSDRGTLTARNRTILFIISIFSLTLIATLTMIRTLRQLGKDRYE